MKPINHASILAILGFFQASGALSFDCNGVQFTDDYVSRSVDWATTKFEAPLDEKHRLEFDARYFYYPLLASGEIYKFGMARENHYVRVERVSRARQVVRVSDASQPPNSRVNENPMLCSSVD
ncbi:CSEP0122 putative effector protein [Blumeria hordei DH14]|uniref:CSEP0122 putative effector protein n=1 Tax=Blumeria graminis f. sp. hordei (strain DH14) TaxID=546991 RepID=N1JNK1_BLUG1|nr:CSEP0122 putative effector protein [Blumeria hordei DH14]